MKKNLAMAGIDGPPPALVSSSSVLATGLALGYSIGALTDQLLLGISLGGLFGYLTPVLWLRLRINKHQANLTFSLPDALDLLVVCGRSRPTIDASSAASARN